MKNKLKRIHKQQNLFVSFLSAINGVRFALHYERNFRIHIAASIYILYFSNYYNLSKAEYAILFLVIGLVIVCELINTAIENTVNIKTLVYNEFAKIAKDVAAGAVLMCAITSIACGIMLFYDPIVINLILEDIIKNIFVWLAILCITVCIIILTPSKKTKEK